MTVPVVESTATSADTSATTSHTVTMPAGVTSGDLLICIFKPASGTGTWSVSMTGWTLLASLEDGFNGASYAFYREADGTEGASETVTTGNSVKSAHITYRVSGWDSGQAPEGQVAAAGSEATFTPTWGSADNLYISALTARKCNWDATKPSTYGSETVSETSASSTSTIDARVESAHLTEASSASETAADYAWSSAPTGTAEPHALILGAKGAAPVVLHSSVLPEGLHSIV